MKELQKVVQKLTRGQEAAAAAPVYEPVQKHKVTPGIPGWLKNHHSSQVIYRQVSNISRTLADN